MNICERCQQNPATIHVTEIKPPPDGDPSSPPTPASPSNGADGPDEAGQAGPAGIVFEQHVCEACAQSLDLPHQPVKKTAKEIWKLLQISAQRNRRDAGLACPDCGMTLLEFRQKGRMGCARDYEVFGVHARDLLERIHGATKHVGRGPGIEQEDLDRMRRANELERALESAIREEAYEQAARLRDELKSLQEG